MAPANKNDTPVGKSNWKKPYLSGWNFEGSAAKLIVFHKPKPLLIDFSAENLE